MEYKRLKYEDCREGIRAIRQKVFVEEQNCPENMEWDEAEELDSLYFVAFKNDLAVGCLRLRHIELDVLKMERVAVLKEFRRRGIASELIREAMLHTQTEAPSSSIYAYAQVSAIQAYVSLGFKILSKVWIEDGTFIPHQTIFWGTPQSIELFLKHQAEKAEDVVYEEYDARHPAIRPKIEEFKKRLENLSSLHLLLNDSIVSRRLRRRFSKFCSAIDRFLNIENHSSDLNVLVKEGNYLLKLADSRLNIGHFSEVNENWRVFYSLVSFTMSFALWKQEKYEAAIFVADKGLCMGRCREEDIPIRHLASLIHQNLSIPSTSSIHQNFLTSKEKCKKLESLPNSLPIPECLDNENTFELLLQSIQSEHPLLVRNLASNMPAVTKWTFPFLLETMHSRTFPVEIGSAYSAENWSQRMMTFGEFISNEDNEMVYLAQHNLLDQVPQLKQDIIIPDVCFGESDQVDVNMWIGPVGTVSPLHTDPRKNMFVQVHGTKVFRLVAPKDTDGVYPIDGLLSNTSRVDVEKPDFEEFPNFSTVQVFDGVVNPGDALFIPRKWWHYVRSTTPSISVSFWFD